MSNLHPRWQQLLGSLVGAHFYGDAKDILVRVLAEHDADENDRLRADVARLELACATFEESSAISLRDAAAAEAERDRLRVVADECVKLLERDKLLVDWEDLLAKLKVTT